MSRSVSTDRPLRLVLIGDGESPHLLKWARALAPRLALWAVSSRGFLPGFDGLLPPDRRLALGTRPDAAGGNIGLLRQLPALRRWLLTVQADWLHAHYLSSHGTLAWLARRAGAPGRLVGSAWGSDILVTPRHSRLMRAVTRRVLRDCTLATSDSQVMTHEMHALGAGEVMTFPFGLEALPEPVPAADKQPWRVFANRGLEPIYAPERVLAQFAALAAVRPEAELVIANDGSLRGALEAAAAALPPAIAARIRFVGRLDAATQAQHYRAARWYVSLPTSDSVAVSVLEAMAHGCIPLLSDLPANRELVRDGDNGALVPSGATLAPAAFDALAARAAAIAAANHDWVAREALFGPCVDRFLDRLRALTPPRR
ncbi:glycosyltransferase [Pseudaquabacterium rugosum]|uniref:Glycosyltransferase n=1 Tax=Pseudaquabacterium rugosum TaxID=2984194 RepID=A0ABU9B4J5_9BURK